MYKHNLLTLFLSALMLININNYSNAADYSEFFRSTLSVYRIVYNATGPTSTTIDCDTGNLAASLAPRFFFATNLPSMGITNWAMTAEIEDNLSNTFNAFYGTAANPSLILANETVPPTAAAINDIRNGTLTNNPNVISYPVGTALTLGTGTLNIDINQFQDVNDYYEVRSRGKGARFINLDVATTARAGTYNSLDAAGDYCATITFQYGNP